MRLHHTAHNQHAVIVGAGLDGLLTARILVDYCSRVTVITADRLADAPPLPAHFWQAVPSHILAVQGYRHLERLFPGLTAELMVAGAPTIEWTADAVTLLPGGWFMRGHSDLISRPVTEPTLLRVIRQRLLDYAGERLHFLEARSLQSIEWRESRVAGVTVRGLRDGITESIQTDLLVDGGGRRDRLPDWLERCGHPIPEQTMIPAGVGVSICLVTRPADYRPGWQAALVIGGDQQPGGALVPVEGGRWLALLTTPGSAPADEGGFRALAGELRTPIIADALRQAVCLTPVFALTDSQAVRWHVERLTDGPDNLLMTGTGAISLHPAYGFDLTISTLAALTLRESLDEQRRRQANGDLSGLSRRFYERLTRAFAPSWLLLAARDSDQAVGQAGLLARFLQRYGDRFLAAACVDAQVYRDLMAVIGLAAPPRTLLQPSLLRRVFQVPDVRPFLDPQPPVFEPLHIHKTITQEIASVAGGKDS